MADRVYDHRLDGSPDWTPHSPCRTRGECRKQQLCLDGSNCSTAYADGDYLRAFDGESYGDVVCWAHGPGCAMTDEVCAPLPLAGSMADDCYDHLAGELLPEPMMPSVRIGAPIIAMALVGWAFVIFGALAVVKLVETFVAAVR